MENSVNVNVNSMVLNNVVRALNRSYTLNEKDEVPLLVAQLTNGDITYRQAKSIICHYQAMVKLRDFLEIKVKNNEGITSIDNYSPFGDWEFIDKIEKYLRRLGVSIMDNMSYMSYDSKAVIAETSPLHSSEVTIEKILQKTKAFMPINGYERFVYNEYLQEKEYSHAYYYSRVIEAYQVFTAVWKTWNSLEAPSIKGQLQNFWTYEVYQHMDSFMNLITGLTDELQEGIDDCNGKEVN